MFNSNEFTSGLVSKQDAVNFVIKFSNFQKRILFWHTQSCIHDWSNTKDILGRLRLPLIRWQVKIMFKQDLIHYLCYKKYHHLAWKISGSVTGRHFSVKTTLSFPGVVLTSLKVKGFSSWYWLCRPTIVQYRLFTLIYKKPSIMPKGYRSLKTDDHTIHLDWRHVKKNWMGCSTNINK